MSQLIQTYEILSFHDMFGNFLDEPTITKKTSMSEASMQTGHWQEQINVKKSDDEMHQII